MAPLPTGFGNSWIFQLRQLATVALLATVVVKELAKANEDSPTWKSTHARPDSVEIKCTRVWLGPG